MLAHVRLTCHNVQTVSGQVYASMCTVILFTLCVCALHRYEFVRVCALGPPE